MDSFTSYSYILVLIGLIMGIYLNNLVRGVAAYWLRSRMVTRHTEDTKGTH